MEGLFDLPFTEIVESIAKSIPAVFIVASTEQEDVSPIAEGGIDEQTIIRHFYTEESVPMLAELPGIVRNRITDREHTGSYQVQSHDCDDYFLHCSYFLSLGGFPLLT